MKIFFIICILLLPVICFSQKLKLEISTPQPRLGEDFNITVDINTLSLALFSSLSKKFDLSTFTNDANQSSLLGVNLKPRALGKSEIGPVTLNINGKQYITDKITFEVVDSLPAVNKGLWIRQVKINDTSSYIILEQRIPALTYITRTDTSINMTTKTNDDDKDVEMVQDSTINFEGSNRDTRSVIDPKTNEKLSFQYSFALYKVKIADKHKPTILTKSDFNNLPDYYKFQDIIINH